MKKVRGWTKKTVWRKSSGYFVVVVLAAAGFMLLTEPESARSHEGAVHPSIEGDAEIGRHRTHWICPKGEECTWETPDNLIETVEKNEWESQYKECPGPSESGCRHGGAPPNWSDNWRYRGHSDEWTHRWSCPATHKKIEPLKHWGATYEGATYVGEGDNRMLSPAAIAAQPKPSEDTSPVSPSFSWPHCVRKPELVITPAAPAANEGSSVSFNIELKYASGDVTWSTSDGTATAGTHYTAITNGSGNLHSGNRRTTTVNVQTRGNSLTEDRTFTLTATYGSLSVSKVGTIKNVAPPPDNPPPSTPTPTTPTPTTTIPAGLTVSSATATEGSDLVFTVELSGTSGTVSWWTLAGTALGSGTNRDFVPLGSDNAPETWTAGTEEEITVKTLTDLLAETDETLWLKVQATTPNGTLTATGQGTITDKDVEPTEPPGPGPVADPGGWKSTEACDNGIVMIRGHDYGIYGTWHLPVWTTPSAAGVAIVYHRWQIYAERAAGPGSGNIPSGFAVNGVKHRFSQRAEGEIANVVLGGTVANTVSDGKYSFTIGWSTRLDNSRRTVRSRDPSKYPCSVNVEPRPARPSCPARRSFRHGEYAAVRVAPHDQRFKYGLTAHPAGMNVVDTGAGTWLRGVPTRLGITTAHVTKKYEAAE